LSFASLFGETFDMKVVQRPLLNARQKYNTSNLFGT